MWNYLLRRLICWFVSIGLEAGEGKRNVDVVPQFDCQDTIFDHPFSAFLKGRVKNQRL
jgi:hypothetical protein